MPKIRGVIKPVEGSDIELYNRFTQSIPDDELDKIKSEADLQSRLDDWMAGRKLSKIQRQAVMSGGGEDLIARNKPKLEAKPKGLRKMVALLRTVRVRRRDGRVQRYHIKTENLKKRYQHRGRGLYVRR